MRVESAQVVNTDVVVKLLTSLPALFEEVGAKPDFLQMCFVGVFGQDLLDCHFPLRRTMHAQPDQAEPSSSQQANPLEILGKAFPKLPVFICSQVGLHIQTTLFPTLIIELHRLFLLVLALAGRGALLYAFVLLLLLTIK